MTELRWALLLAGILFVAGLVAWELRKRRARDGARGRFAMPGGGGRDAPIASGRTHDPAAGVPSAGAASREEPSFSMPELSRRDPLRDLPVVEIDPRVAEGPRVGDLPVISMDDDPASPSAARHDAAHAAAAATAAPDGVPGSHEAPPLTPAQAAAPAPAPAADPVERASAWLADSVPNELPQAVVLDWPPEAQRRIVALRVVPRPGERFNGSALRQALVGEGFIHGELDIYHKPAGDGRAMISAASLTRPGTFDPRTIDGLLFAGLNLFAVLPGPLSPRDTVERLLLVARTLAQRLRGEALDGRGQPLTDARVAELRREAVEGAP